MLFSRFFLALLILTNFVFADDSIPPKPVEVGMQIIEVNHQKILSINYKNYPEWHTYWKNPGDAGLAIENHFSIKGKEINLLNYEWPVPHKFIENGSQWAYGYRGEYSLFYKLDKETQTKFFGKTIELSSKWLVCKNICVPGSKSFNFTLTRDGIKNKSSELMNDVDDSALTERFIKIPQLKNAPDYLNIRLAKGEGPKSLTLQVTVKNSTDKAYLQDTNMIFALPQKPFDFTHEVITTTSDSLIGTTPISWDGEYQTPPVALSENGKFLRPYNLKFLFNDPISKETYLIEKNFSNFETTPIKVALVSNTEKKNNEVIASTPKTDTTNSSLIYYLCLAFIGGLILNIMPCVLPVISLKLFGLIKYQRESKKRILEHNVFYTIGILLTFLALALIIVTLKNFGTVVGWGFQLQSPNFIAIMIIVLFIFALNLFGMFEFHTPGGSFIGNIKTQETFIGDMLGGVLATILSTPCSAPFLGTALTFAFSSSPLTIISMFMMIGLGLAFPFILTGIFPNLVSFLPKPGKWMNNVKKLLGLTLILTCFWLFDVFNTLVNGQNHIVKLLFILLLLFVGIYVRKKEKWFSRIAYLLSLLVYLNMINTTLIEVKDGESALIRDKQAKGLNWEPWSEQKLDEYKTNHQVVFVDFTAKWCFTCKVNERLVLDTDEFKNFVTNNNLKLLIGDWTKRDEVIGNYLMKHKMVGVPAYFIQKADGTLIGLGETISINKLKQNLN